MCFRINIPQNANSIIHTLQNNGHTAYIVGGCVRDSVLGLTPNDWDICTSATPDEMLEIFKDYKVIKTGLKHGTVTVVIDGEQYECTTYRIDGTYSDSRRPDNVSYTDDIVLDLSRRDFTINAMAYNDKEGLIDPFNGLEDLYLHIIRCVGTPEDRFTEDALRMLRAIRFAVQLGCDLDESTHGALLMCSSGLLNISTERIHNELCKIMSTPNYTLLDKCLETFPSVFALIIPYLKDTFYFNQHNPYHDYDVYIHTAKALSNCKSNDLITRLALLFHDIGKPHCYQTDSDGVRHFRGHGSFSASYTNAIMTQLKFDKCTRRNVVELVKYHDSTIESTPKAIKRWLNKIGVEQFRRLLDVRRADILGQKLEVDHTRIDKLNTIEDILNTLLADDTCFTLKNLAINGKDLIDAGFVQGCFIGEMLNTLLEKVIFDELPNDADTLLNYALNCLKNNNN